jgi:hypothetical protein
MNTGFKKIQNIAHDRRKKTGKQNDFPVLIS